MSALVACGSDGHGDIEDETIPVIDDDVVDIVPPASEAPQVITWTSCAVDVAAQGFECGYLDVPRDYAEPGSPTIRLAITRLPARDPSQRIGSLFMNFGGPGLSTVFMLQSGAAGYFGLQNPRFDIVGVDPRGTGATQGAVNCQANPELLGPDAQPFFSEEALDLSALRMRAQLYVDLCLENNDLDILAHATTANTARDMDSVRVALAEEQLTYLGFSYGTLLGATYAALFPDRYRAMVLDGAVDAVAIMNDVEIPPDSPLSQAAAFERALDRFFAACAADQTACSGFGGDDPARAFDALLARAAETPIPTTIERPSIGADDLRMAMLSGLYSKQSWLALASALAQADSGDGGPILAFADGYYGRRSDGTYDASYDSFVVLSALEAHAERDTSDDALRRTNAETWQASPHFGWGAADWQLIVGSFPLRAAGSFRGSFELPSDAAPVLVVGTTFDPATPYAGAEALVAELENARLLTMDGDGHTAYGDNSTCIDVAVENYLAQLTLTPPGTRCDQNVPFAALSAQGGGPGASSRRSWQHARPAFGVPARGAR